MDIENLCGGNFDRGIEIEVRTGALGRFVPACVPSRTRVYAREHIYVCCVFACVRARVLTEISTRTIRIALLNPCYWHRCPNLSDTPFYPSRAARAGFRLGQRWFA